MDDAHGNDARLPAQPHETIDRLADGVLPALIARLDASGLGELEVRAEGWRIRLRKPYDRRRSLTLPEGRRRRGEAGEGPHQARHERPDAGSTAGADPGRGTAGQASSGRREEHGRGARAGLGGAAGREPAGPGGALGDGHGPGGGPDPQAGRGEAPAPAVATAPAVGYFGTREGWTTGRHVRSGDVVGYVDCLGVRQEVMAPVDGFLGRLLAEPGEAVEYGQPLLHIDLPAPPPQPSPSAAPDGGTDPEGD